MTRRARAGSRYAPRHRCPACRVRERCPAPAGSTRRHPRARGARWLRGREERVFQRVLPRLRAPGEQVRGHPRRRTRSRLQRPADGQVDRGPGRRAQAIDDGLAIEVVGEPGRGGARDDAGLTGLIQQAQRRGLVAARGAVRQQADVDVAARDGRPLQQPDAFRGEPGQPAPQRVGDAGRDLGRLLPRALREKQPDQLPDEERVAAAALPQLGGDLGRKRRPGQLPGQRSNVVRGEAGQDELLGPPGDRVQLRRGLGVPVGAEQGHGFRGQGAGQESQQPQRRLVGPVQVVEHHEHGAIGGQTA